MKALFIAIIAAVLIYSCDSAKAPIGDNNLSSTKSDTVRIANDSLEYEIIIIEPGFQSWIFSQPPRGFYGQTFLENKNRLWVSEYNNRVREFNRYPRNLYEQEINYEYNTDYGYEVNYMLYNYFVYFQEEYNQNFIGGRN